MAIRWNASLSVGVPIIDGQHRRIIREAAALISAMRASQADAYIERTLRFMTGYALTHFEAEERLMLDRGYAQVEVHAREHDVLRARVRQLVYDFRAFGPSLPVATALNTFVCHWFFDHIGQSDRALAEWLHGRKGERPPTCRRQGRAGTGSARCGGRLARS